jgi:hypothetical protein
MNPETTFKHKQWASTSGLLGVSPTSLPLGEGRSKSRWRDAYRKEN